MIGASYYFLIHNWSNFGFAMHTTQTFAQSGVIRDNDGQKSSISQEAEAGEFVVGLHVAATQRFVATRPTFQDAVIRTS